MSEEKTERTVVKGFYTEKQETPVYEEEHFIPMEEAPESVNITWLIWAFAVAVMLIVLVSTTSLVLNVSTRKQLIELKQEITNE